MKETTIIKPPVDASRPHLNVTSELGRLQQAEALTGKPAFVFIERVSEDPTPPDSSQPDKKNMWRYITKIDKEGNAEYVARRWDALNERYDEEIMYGTYSREYGFEGLGQGIIDRSIHKIVNNKTGEAWRTQITNWELAGVDSVPEDLTTTSDNRLANEFEALQTYRLEIEKRKNLNINSEDPDFGHHLIGKVAGEPDNEWDRFGQLYEVKPSVDSKSSPVVDITEELKEYVTVQERLKLEYELEKERRARKNEEEAYDWDAKYKDAISVNRSVADAKDEAKKVKLSTNETVQGVVAILNPESLAVSWRVKNKLSEKGKQGRNSRRILRRIVNEATGIKFFKTSEQIRAEKEAWLTKSEDSTSVSSETSIPLHENPASNGETSLPEGITEIIQKSGRKVYMRDGEFVSPVDFLNKRMRAERDGIPYERPPRRLRRPRRTSATSRAINGHQGGATIEHGEQIGNGIRVVIHESDEFLVVAEGGADLPVNAELLAEGAAEQALSSGVAQAQEIADQVSESLGGVDVTVFQPVGAASGNGHN